MLVLVQALALALVLVLVLVTAGAASLTLVLWSWILACRHALASHGVVVALPLAAVLQPAAQVWHTYTLAAVTR